MFKSIYPQTVYNVIPKGQRHPVTVVEVGPNGVTIEREIGKVIGLWDTTPPVYCQRRYTPTRNSLGRLNRVIARLANQNKVYFHYLSQYGYSISF